MWHRPRRPSRSQRNCCCQLGWICATGWLGKMLRKNSWQYLLISVTWYSLPIFSPAAHLLISIFVFIPVHSHLFPARLSCVFLPSYPAFVSLLLPDYPVFDPVCLYIGFRIPCLPLVGFVCLIDWSPGSDPAVCPFWIPCLLLVGLFVYLMDFLVLTLFELTRSKLYFSYPLCLLSSFCVPTCLYLKTLQSHPTVVILLFAIKRHLHRLDKSYWFESSIFSDTYLNHSCILLFEIK